MKAVRELGLDRRETGRSLSMLGEREKRKIIVYDRIGMVLTSGIPVVFPKAPLGS